MKKNTRQFFDQMQAELGNNDGRFLKELAHHVEDREAEKKLSLSPHLEGKPLAFSRGRHVQSQKQSSQEQIESPEQYLGSPHKLVRAYRFATFLGKFPSLGTVLSFVVVFSLVSLVPFMEAQTSWWFNVLALTGFFLYLFALPVIFLQILLGGLTFFIFGNDVNSSDFSRFVFTPLVTAFFYSFLFMVFFSKPFWSKRKSPVHPPVSF